MKFIRSSSPSLNRSQTLSDLILVCKDGYTHAHQYVLGRNSRFLKKVFSQDSYFVKVELVESKLQGVPAKIKTETQVGARKLILADYDLATVEILLDLLYKGEADSVGQLDRVSGRLCLSHLCQDLGFDHDFGGLPDIGDLEFVPCSHRHFKELSDDDLIKDQNDDSFQKDIDYDNMEQNMENNLSKDGDFSIASTDQNDDDNNNDSGIENREDVTEANKRIEILQNDLSESNSKIKMLIETELSLKSNLDKEMMKIKDLEEKFLVQTEEKEVLEQKLENLETNLRMKEDLLCLKERNLEKITESLEDKNKQVKELKNKVEGFELNDTILKELQEKIAKFKEISEQKDAKINKLSSSLIKEKQALLLAEVKVKDLEEKAQQFDVYVVNRSVERKDLEIGKLKEDLAREKETISSKKSEVGRLQTVLAEKNKMIQWKDSRIFELEQEQKNFSNKEASYKAANQQSLKKVQTLKCELLEESNKTKRFQKDYNCHLEEMKTVFQELLDKFHDIRGQLENEDLEDTTMADLDNFEITLQERLDNIPEDDSPILVTVDNHHQQPHQHEQQHQRKRIMYDDFIESSSKAPRRESNF